MWPIRSRKRHRDVELDEVLLDATNLPSFNQGRLEGRIELPIVKRNVFIVGAFFSVIALAFLVKLFSLQVIAGEEFAHISTNNRFDEVLVIAERGVLYDRRGELLAWNEEDPTGEHDFPVRAYSDRAGIGSVIGYVSYPKKDNRGYYYRTEYLGRDGAEAAFDEQLRGKNGQQIIEVDALGQIVGEHIIDDPTPGEPLTLSLDAELSEAWHDIIATSSAQAGFRSGAGVLLDVNTGEIVAMTSFPSFDPEVMADGDDVAAIEAYGNDERLPFLNKAVDGVYTPGSVVKPFMAYAALVEDIISPQKIIVSTGEIVIPNPYSPNNPSRFTDWRAHGQMTMKEAIAFSSNVYFYIIGGGFGDQSGLGISRINKYMKLFGFGELTGIKLGSEKAGTVPSPEWKADTFADDWRLGDTYFTAIGQFGWQTTPLQLVRAYAALGNGGRFFTPHFMKDTVGEYYDVELDQDALAVIHEGMTMTTFYPGGTARGLERDDVLIAAKSGTAEVGAGNQFVNSWAAGFWPYEDPKYAFILMMERAPRANTLGATTIMGDVVDWMAENRPEYLGLDNLNVDDE